MLPENFIVNDVYNTDNKFVFQYLGLGNLVRERGKEKAKRHVKKQLHDLLRNTADYYNNTMVNLQDKGQCLRTLDSIAKAEESYRSGNGTIVVFYGDYLGDDNDDKIVFRFRKRGPPN